MRKKMVSKLAMLLAMLLAVTGLAGVALAEAPADVDEAQFEQWNADAPALNALIEYVEAVTDASSPDYIPEEDRIAVFDMDGTLMGELYPTYLEYYMLAWRILKDPTFEPDAEMLEVGRTLRDCALDNSFPEDMPMQHAIQAARAYAGMTLLEFANFVTTILVREADGFEGMTYGEAYYLPMEEVVEYLQENDFKCYVCSGSDRFICRTFIEGMVDIPFENVIGMDVALEATGQGDTEGLNYVYTTSDDVVRTDKLLIKNLKMNKVAQIAQEIGRQPVLSFGNSSGDVSMHNYVLYNNRYRSASFQLIADDEVRDYGSAEKGAELREKWEGMGFNVISMANDWKTIYGDDVVKTGVFHWLEDFAEPEEKSSAQQKYTLNRVVALSRHNIRSPLSGSGSLLGDITPHSWFDWTSNPSELSLRGAVLETLMGQYFRLWLEDEGLFPENYRPEEGAVRFYANAKQRTLATARYFSAGLLPVAVVPVERKGEYNEADDTFLPIIRFMNDDYARDVMAEISAGGGGGEGISGYMASLKDAFQLLKNVTGMEQSEAYLSGKYGNLEEDESIVTLEA